MYRLGLKRQFSGRHYLIGGDWGEENIEHIHQYQLELILEARELDEHGFLVDIDEVERHLDETIALFEGKTLNDMEAFHGLNPSIERLATIFHQLFRVKFGEFNLESLSVTIWEDDIAWTSYHTTL